MSGLTSGNFKIFETSEWILNLNSSNCRAPKIIFNDTEFEPVSWELRIENSLFNFRVGVGVGGHHATNFSHISKDVQENNISFDTNAITGGYREKWSYMKNRPKNENYGGKNCVGLAKFKLVVLLI